MDQLFHQEKLWNKTYIQCWDFQLILKKINTLKKKGLFEKQLSKTFAEEKGIVFVESQEANRTNVMETLVVLIRRRFCEEFGEDL